MRLEGHLLLCSSTSFLEPMLTCWSKKLMIGQTLIRIKQCKREVTKKPNYCNNKIIFEIIFLRNRKHVPCFYRVIETRVEVWENEKCCGNTSRRRVFPQLFRVLPNFHECFDNSIETRRKCFLFLLENTATRKKRKTTC